MKYLIFLLLLVGCAEVGTVYTTLRSECIQSHRESYVCTRYDSTLKIQISSTCYRTRCTQYNCYSETRKKTGWFSSELLKSKEISKGVARCQ